MITEKQKKLYQNILLEVLSSGIDIKYENFLFNSLKNLDGELKKKIQAYHVFFKSISSIPKDKHIVTYSFNEFNLFLEEIRMVLSENKYILKMDAISFDNALAESKKSMDFNYYLK